MGTMRKLKLAVEDLRLDSFAPADDRSGSGGTVRSNESYDTFYCTNPATYNYPGCNTDDASWTKASCYEPCFNNYEQSPA
jgi:hypothetical protein